MKGRSIDVDLQAALFAAIKGNSDPTGAKKSVLGILGRGGGLFNLVAQGLKLEKRKIFRNAWRSVESSFKVSEFQESTPRISSKPKPKQQAKSHPLVPPLNLMRIKEIKFKLDRTPRLSAVYPLVERRDRSQFTSSSVSVKTVSSK